MTRKINWKEELLDSEQFNKKQINLLKSGTKSLINSWLLSVLCTRWRKLKDIREQASPNCSSNFLEWNKKVKDVEECQS
ncbi:hypothetical protein [Prochlorococcus marinus]|uniref:Uncharacterized protein n=1 Tax=Prochlorococcus marinus XMU1408 TaxID=2213228 RepID=A0A318RCD0_PROMR|nr:hypothetical protein [Prochlorococcus marinus]MBW3041073.1 hypothetical protein [Prochlorococcus marinus str. XMU1408]PYE03678.1 hypothetical protein DNJ73_00370 [Prochlorococcus marinus XMU1408]